MRFDHNPFDFASLLPLPPAESRPAKTKVGHVPSDDPDNPRLRRIAGRLSADLPIIIGLCCGDGGFAEGAIAAGAFVIGVDIVHFAGIDSLDPSRFFFIQTDVLSLEPLFFFKDQRPVLVFSGAPCEEASRHKMPWTRKKNPPPPDLSIIRASERIAAECGAPFILENSQAMQQFIGKAATHYGPHYLWGDVPAMLPHRSWYSKKKKESYSGSEAHLRARLPLELSKFLAQSFIAGNQKVSP